MSDKFYRSFEDRYRGSRDLIKSRLQIYLPFLKPLLREYPNAGAIDLGCGRGEWLELLKETGLSALGVDLDDGMLSACRALGLNVITEDALTILKSLPDNSQLVVSGFHIAEHIPFHDLQTLVQEALRVLKPAGLLILETPNPENLVVGSCNFYLDPTHQQPIPPLLLSFLTENYGFSRTKILRLQEPSHLIDKRELSLYDVLTGVSPDYAVVAQKSADEAILAVIDHVFEQTYGLGLDVLADRYDRTLQDGLRATLSKAEQAEARATQAEANASQAEARATQAEANASQAEARATQAEAVAYQAKMRATQAEASANCAEMRIAQTQALVQDLEKPFLNNSRSHLIMLVRNIVHQLVRKTNDALLAHPQLKHDLSLWVFKKYPNLHNRLRQIVRQRQSIERESLHIRLETHTSPLAEKWSSVLSDASLVNLERPTESNAEVSSPKNLNDSESLEPLIELDQMRQSPASVSFVIPIYQADRESLDSTIQSVLRQTDPAWEILLCASPENMALAEDWLDIDWRIRRLSISVEGTESHQLLQASIQATTAFIGLLSQGDLINGNLVMRIGEASRKNPEVDIIYTDEIRQSDNGALGQPFYKPDWSPEHQQSVNMLGRFVAVRKSLLLDLPRPQSKSAEAAEYELSLKIIRQAHHIAHIDDALYVRTASSLPPVGGFFSSLALPDARNALERHLGEEDSNVRVTMRPMGSLNVQWSLPKDTPITLLILSGMHEREIPGRGQIVLATHFVKSILEKSSLDHYKIIVVDDGYVDPELKGLLEAHGHATCTAPKKSPFSFASKANFASSLVSSGIVILLNDDLEVISPDWIQALASQAARPEIGAVGCKLLFADGLLQHAGVVLGFHGSAGHIFHRAPNDGKEYAGFASIERNYSAVTGAVLAYQKKIFEEVGGFDEQLKTDYNDIDFCLKCIDLGYRVVYTPGAVLYHFHNSSLQRLHDKPAEREIFMNRWRNVVSRDPYFSKHFQTHSSDLPLLVD
ncbi:glycosyltransferase [Diaphorobacter sp.]|uniref:methyltransferase domain-containing protein n=1 Tax=Diaphorobacter sp. TaxID=1934310 RepID=UPI002582BF4A|nr:glycosyltransferase [Diaphorobacter sp.]